MAGLAWMALQWVDLVEHDLLQQGYKDQLWHKVHGPKRQADPIHLPTRSEYFFSSFMSTGRGKTKDWVLISAEY